MLSVLLSILLLAAAGALSAAAAEPMTVVRQYCVDCHDADSKKGDVDLESVLGDDPALHAEVWERVIRQMRGGLMPPANKKRPGDPARREVLASLEQRLDAAAEHPNPGRTSALRRLTRTEYQNVIRDLLALEIDATTLLPPDELSHGFDNVTVSELSPTLLDRYITAAQRIARLAVGGAMHGAGGETFRVKPDVTQEQRVEGLPPGTRGGTVISYAFPLDGMYDVQVRLARDRNEHVEGLKEAHELLVLVDDVAVKRFTIEPAKGQDHQHVDEHLKLRLPVRAGPHRVGVTFVQKGASLQETVRQPYSAHFNFHRHPRLTPAVYQVSIVGPFEATGPGDTPSRRRILVAQPSGPAEEEACARRVLSVLLRRAWRRPVTDDDVESMLRFYRDGRAEGGFDAGIESALSAVLVSREFLFRVERDPPGAAPHAVYRVSDVELASRMSFFLWSSMPDDELLECATSGTLHEPEVLASQTQRMLRDARSQSLVTNFAAQWLYLRNLESITPDGRLFPDFDDNLRQAFRRETEMLVAEVLREDRSVLELLRCDHTYLNERLAKHYGIPHVYGEEFRRVNLEPGMHRGGLLRQGSLLTVTSYATRTSPVLRGQWVLKNLLGTTPPPPPPKVPALDGVISASLPIRERLALHRKDPACASCHAVIDPIGFALENYDAVGRWREREDMVMIDAEGRLPGGEDFDGVEGLEKALLADPQSFVRTFVEKLLTFGLGRGVELSDAPLIRSIIRKAGGEGYRLSSLFRGVIESDVFLMRRNP